MSELFVHIPWGVVIILSIIIVALLIIAGINYIVQGVREFRYRDGLRQKLYAIEDQLMQPDPAHVAELARIQHVYESRIAEIDRKQALRAQERTARAAQAIAAQQLWNGR